MSTHVFHHSSTTFKPHLSSSAIASTAELTKQALAKISSTRLTMRPPSSTPNYQAQAAAPTTHYSLIRDAACMIKLDPEPLATIREACQNILDLNAKDGKEMHIHAGMAEYFDAGTKTNHPSAHINLPSFDTALDNSIKTIIKDTLLQQGISIHENVNIRCKIDQNTLPNTSLHYDGMGNGRLLICLSGPGTQFLPKQKQNELETKFQASILNDGILNTSLSDDQHLQIEANLESLPKNEGIFFVTSFNRQAFLQDIQPLAHKSPDNTTMPRLFLNISFSIK